MKRCIIYSILFLSVNAFAQPKIYYHANKCTGQESVITIDSLSGFSLPVEYSIDNSPYQLENSFMGYSEGDHTLDVLDAEHNQYSFVISVEEAQSPTFQVHYDYMDCSKREPIEITELSGDSPPFQIFVNDEPIVGTKTVVNESRNEILVRDKNGCETLEVIRVKSKCFSPYNAITPNGDGYNDNWEIPQLKRFPNAQVTIYNKWGQEIHRAEAPYSAWDGSNLPMATYYYVIQLDGNSDNENVLTGDITIVR